MRTLILTLIISLGLTSCKTSAKQSFYNQEKTQKHFSLQNFSGIQVSQGIEVEITPGNKNEADVESDAMEYLVMEVKNNTLVIRYDKAIRNYMKSSKTKVKLTAKNIENFKASSSGEIKVKGRFNTEQANINVSSSGEVEYNFKGKTLNIDVSSSGEVEGNIEVEKLNIDASSSADVELKGNADTVTIQASSSADVELEGLNARKVKVRASSSADVKLNVSESINARASSGADVKYKVNGKLNTNISTSSSGGSVKKVSSF